MTPSPVLRFVRFRPLNLAFDGDFRAVVIPDLVRLPGLIDHYIARQGPDEIGQRVAATIWESEDAMTAAVGSGIGGGGFHAEFYERITDASLRILPLAVADRYDTARQPLILRCFEGRTRPGEREAFVKEERLATQAKVKAGSGPLALSVSVATTRSCGCPPGRPGWTSKPPPAEGSRTRSGASTRSVSCHGN